MTFNEFFEIEVLVNNSLLAIQPSGYSFQIEDSIHSTYPRVVFWLRDVPGIFQEYLTSTEGLKYQITYGTTDNDVTIKSKYVVKQDSLSEVLSPGIFNGNIKVELCHEYYDQQEILSSAYTNRISLIIDELVQKYPFSSTDINDTGNQDTWYQMLCTDEQFMRHVLLPHAFSGNSFNSPFFMFINSNNTFHWRNYKSMIDESPVAELTYVPQSEESSSNKNVIRNIQRVHVPITHRLRRSILQVDYENGSLIEEEDSILDYPSSTSTVPVIENQEVLKEYLFQGYSERLSGKSENDIGYQIYSMKESLFLDRFVIELPLNVSLLAGKTIRLDIRSYETDDGQQSSLAYRGIYLIEKTKHSWDGPNQVGFTTALISRKEIDVPNSYLIGKQLLGA